MINLAIIDSGKAFLPETNAYLLYFNELTEKKIIARKFSSIAEADEWADIIIFYGGIIPFWTKLKAKLIIEYHSLSTGRYPRLKNIIKRLVNKKANGYIYLNDAVKTGYFHGNNKFRIRGMGFDSLCLSLRSTPKDYDLVYLGSLRERVEFFVNNFAQKGYRVAVIGCEKKDFIKPHRNVDFFGKVSNAEALRIAARARYGLNFTPNVYPYNIQDSTKLIEYSALGLSVVTNHYAWVYSYEKELNTEFSPIECFELPENNTVKVPENKLTQRSWGNVIKNSDIISLIYEVDQHEK